jgi:hypothetical protein
MKPMNSVVLLGAYAVLQHDERVSRRFVIDQRRARRCRRRLDRRDVKLGIAVVVIVVVGCCDDKRCRLDRWRHLQIGNEVRLPNR